MTVSSVRSASLYVGLCTLLIAGCAHAPTPPPAATPVATPDTAAALTPVNTTPPERQHYIMELLAAGKREQARVEAQQLVKEEPTDTEAATLLNEIDADPQTLLGSNSFSYTIQPGETLSTLADRFLGDSNLFYALARYNNIDVPNDAAPGQAILIPKIDHPDHADRPERASHTDRREKEAAPVLRRRDKPEEAVKKTPNAPAEPAPIAVPAPAHDPAKANSLRSQALVEMNRGAIDRAVSLLREASRLDPGSGPISADLARAVRIQGATHK